MYNRFLGKDPTQPWIRKHIQMKATTRKIHMLVYLISGLSLTGKSCLAEQQQSVYIFYALLLWGYWTGSSEKYSRGYWEVFFLDFLYIYFCLCVGGNTFLFHSTRCFSTAHAIQISLIWRSGFSSRCQCSIPNVDAISLSFLWYF